MKQQPLFHIGEDNLAVFQYVPTPRSPRSYGRNARANLEEYERRMAWYILPAIALVIAALCFPAFAATTNNAPLVHLSLGTLVVVWVIAAWMAVHVMGRKESIEKLQTSIMAGNERHVFVTSLDYCSHFIFTKQGTLRQTTRISFFLVSPEMQEIDRTLREPVELTAEAIEARLRTKMMVIDWARTTLGGGAYLNAIEREAIRERDELTKQAKEAVLTRQEELAQMQREVGEIGRELSRRLS
jgi:hypothetical protein